MINKIMNMRNFINLVEDTKTADTLNTLGFAEPNSKGDLATTNSTMSPTLPNNGTKTKKTRNIKPKALDPESHDLLHSLTHSSLQDIISDDEAKNNAGIDDSISDSNDTPKLLGNDIPKTIENLPAVISNALSIKDQNIEPDWIMVKHLPGYLSSAIRAMGRIVFEPFTTTPIEDIQVISTLDGINNLDTIKAMALWIKHNGKFNQSAVLRFHDLLPGYAPSLAIYDYLDYEFMVVEDHAGYYIYGYKPKKNLLTKK